MECGDEDERSELEKMKAEVVPVMRLIDKVVNVEHARARLSVSNKSATHVLRTHANRKLFGHGTCESHRWLNASDE